MNSPNIITIKGNLLTEYIQDRVDILFHQSNCFNTMGSGIAAQVKQYFPEAYESDCLTKKGDPKKLGQFSFAFTEFEKDKKKVVCNLYGQYRYGSPKDGIIFTEYDALLSALENARDWLIKMGMEGKTIGLPYKMGADRAGGDWKVIEKMIQYVFHDANFKVVIVSWDGSK